MIFQASGGEEWFLHAAMISYMIGVMLDVMPKHMPPIGRVIFLAMLACTCFWLGSFIWTLVESRRGRNWDHDEEN